MKLGTQEEWTLKVNGKLNIELLFQKTIFLNGNDQEVYTMFDLFPWLISGRYGNATSKMKI
jgi:hypothetical protein